MNTRGRAAICGAISHYNEVGGYSKTTDILPLCIFKELMVEGFLVGRWAGPRWVEGIKAMAGWVATGKIKVRETVVDGFDKMPILFQQLAGKTELLSFDKLRAWEEVQAQMRNK